MNDYNEHWSKENTEQQVCVEDPRKTATNVVSGFNRARLAFIIYKPDDIR